MSKNAQRNKIFYDKVAEVTELFNKVKANIKDSRTRLNYGFVVNYSTHLSSIHKAIKELKLYSKYDKPILKKDLAKLEKQDPVLDK